jgi:2-polyprenyl-6-methoxyphenol hydroxylase-like FAD-dependent oxidoreductase
MPAGPRPPTDAEVAVVGAGPVGLTLAGRLAQHGVRTIVLEREPAHSGEGSRALCMQRETLEIWARLGIGDRVAERGVQWRTGRTYLGDRELFSIQLPGRAADHFPPFVNISQTEVEDLLIARLAELPGLELRWGQRLTGLVQDAGGVTLACETDAGQRSLRVDYLVGTDGAHSSVRRLLGMGFPGHSHDDLFLICDIRARLGFPNERRFFFDPPWNPGRQVLVHPQADDTWRIDWQVPSGTDAEAERVSGRLDARIRAVVGEATDYELAWMTAYRFHQRLVERFRIGRVLLAGDAAHLMSPFGARGLNSGAADAENLAWKLAAVLRHQAPDALLESYHHERRAAARENLAVTDATMRFMVPHGRLRRWLRNLILRGSTRLPALRRRVNSGRLAEPFVYAGSPVVATGPDDPWLPRHGDVAPDAACRLLHGEAAEAATVTRLRELLGGGFVLLIAAADDELATGAAVRAGRLAWPVPPRVLVAGAGGRVKGAIVLDDAAREIARTYGAAGPRAWLIRPDGHLAGSQPLAGKQSVDALATLQAMALGGLTPLPTPSRPGRQRSTRRQAATVSGVVAAADGGAAPPRG